MLWLAIVVGCNASASDADLASKTGETAPLVVETMPAEIVDVPDFLELEGTLEPNRRARLSPLVPGHVAEVKVERGDIVKKGDALVVLRSKELQLVASSARAQVRAQQKQLGLSGAAKFDSSKVPEVIAAEADLALARDNLQRVTKLYKGGTVPEQTFEQAKAREQAALARLDATKNRALAGRESLSAMRANAAARQSDVANATLVAPFEGAVVSRSVEIGEFVSPQKPIVEIVDASKLRLTLEVPERMAASVAVGQNVAIRVDGTQQELTGSVRFVAAAIDATRRTLAVEVLADNPEGKVRAGHFARARLDLGTKQEAILVPRSSVRERAGVYRVYTVVGGRAAARVVALVEDRGEDWLIRGDIKPGDVLVKSLVADIADGVALKVP